MTLTFYPHTDDAQKGSIEDRLELLLEAADRYKAIILDTSNKSTPVESKRTTPRDQAIAYNWEEIARLLREIREISEATKGEKLRKADFLTKLAEIYEVLRAAKMPKLEAVRLALISEASQLRGGAQVA